MAGDSDGGSGGFGADTVGACGGGYTVSGYGSEVVGVDHTLMKPSTGGSST